MASPTTRAQNVWETQNGNDFLQFLSQTGAILGGISADGSGFGNLTTVSTARLVLSSAQLLSLASTPVQIAPAPGVGNSIFVLASYWSYKFNTTAYTLGNADNQLTLDLGTTSTNTGVSAGGLLDQTASTIVMIGFGADMTFTVLNADNQALNLTLTGTTPGLTLGDGLLIVTVYYFITPTS